MTAVRKLQKIQQDQKSMICLGLDLDPKRMPAPFANTVKGMFDFAHRVIDATSDLVCAYKPNLAFYESLGAEGISLLRLITERIPDHIPIILDGKRGDIGNTASHYAAFLFEKLRGDWVTLNPYMGYDSMRPFLEYKEKGVFVLCLTSNSGSKDFQMLEFNGVPLYRLVAEKVNYWNKEHNCGLVVGATHPEQLDDVRAAAGEMPLLIPGVGAQGGALETAVMSGTDSFRKLALINVSRSVLYASTDQDFAQRARQELEKLNKTVNDLRSGERPDNRPTDQPAPAPQPESPSAPATPSQELPQQPGDARTDQNPASPRPESGSNEFKPQQ